ncbi:MAG: cyclase family protein [Flavobacteriales bacterium]
MIATIQHPLGEFRIDLSKPLDLSIGVHAAGPRAWYADAASIRPVLNQYFTGSVKLGGKVNFFDVHFNPHAHGTHTETVGHIARELVSIEHALPRFWWLAQVISVKPVTLETDNGPLKKGDTVIMLEQLQQAMSRVDVEAVVIRTLPNKAQKKHTLYSNTNFTYMQPEAAQWLAERGVQHLLVDTPSVDREEDGGNLLAHHAFWNYPVAPRMQATISEMIFVDDTIADGMYLLNLQVASFRNDAAPSRPLLHALLG